MRMRSRSVAVWTVVLLAVSSAAMIGSATHAARSPIVPGDGVRAASGLGVRESPEARGGTALPASSSRSGLPAAGSNPLAPPLGQGPASSGWAVSNTLVIYNNTLLSGNFANLWNGAQWEGVDLAPDNLSGEVFVLSQGGVISVISDTTNEVVNSFYPPILGTPASIAFDYKDNEMFVLYYVYDASSYVQVLSATTTAVLATVAVGDGSYGITYDSGLGEVFVSNPQSGNVSVISTATNKVVATIALPLGYPEQLVYDSGQNEVFAINASYRPVPFGPDRDLGRDEYGGREHHRPVRGHFFGIRQQEGRGVRRERFLRRRGHLQCDRGQRHERHGRDDDRRGPRSHGDRVRPVAGRALRDEPRFGQRERDLGRDELGNRHGSARLQPQCLALHRPRVSGL